ncbi:MAG: magnesium transporter [Alphaproteobacteria bacterium]|nr:magnesium transporter [Brevundimonas sp.]MBU3970469.1 magnesium transporter [Alphaproteobacteria bacterium]MBU3974502.1 magnesium transporter [Alphaproteobacteria bacterium]MBU4039744.1 magnesium transporter [Alphaproteobacteria bacterium]MBU4137117.1 magnesium transporter [Alphaproteobacteria bacterium]
MPVASQIENEHLALDEDYVLTAAFVEKVVDASDAGDGLKLRSLLEDLHPADVADLMGFLTAEHRAVVVLWLPADLLADTLSELDDGIREEVLERVPHLTLAEALQELDSDDAAAVVEDLEDDQRERVLAAMPEIDRAAIESSLGYAEDSAGRLMQREVMAAPSFWNVGDTIDHIRKQGEDLPELFFDIYIVDPLNKPVGGLPVSGLLRAPRTVALVDLMEPINAIAVDQDQEEVAYIFEKYHLISAPVIDTDGRLVGQITVDDIVNIIQEENREDILRLAGVSDESRGAGVFGVVRSRIPWLVVNLGTALFASSVIGQFATELEALVYLAILMPVVASIGGNSGTQALTVAVRALASRELNSANATRILAREVLVGLFNGAVIAVLLAGVAWLWFRIPLLSLTIGLAVMINLLAASLAGTLIPLALDRLDRDPAVASPVFVTWITDTVGFFSFLGLAGIILL